MKKLVVLLMLSGCSSTSFTTDFASLATLCEDIEPRNISECIVTLSKEERRNRIYGKLD